LHIPRDEKFIYIIHYLILGASLIGCMYTYPQVWASLELYLIGVSFHTVWIIPTVPSQIFWQGTIPC